MEIKVFWKSNNKEKLLGKLLENDRDEDLKQYPKILFSLIFPKPLKTTNKDEIFKL